MKMNFESVENFTEVQVLERSELEEMVFDEGYAIQDTRFKTKEEGGSFEYFWPADLRLNPHEMKRIAGGGPDSVYVTLKNKELIVGLAQLSPDESIINAYGIRFISVDPVYQGKGYGRELLTGIFEFAKAKDVTLVGSSRSLMGQERLSHVFEDLIEKTGVKYVSAQEKFKI